MVEESNDINIVDPQSQDSMLGILMYSRRKEKVGFMLLYLFG